MDWTKNECKNPSTFFERLLENEENSCSRLYKGARKSGSLKIKNREMRDDSRHLNSVLNWTFFLVCIQVNKKDRSEPKPLIITPSENTHFRVISSLEAKEGEERGKQSTEEIFCNIVKPEPRTIKPHQCSCTPHPTEVSSCDKTFSQSRPELSDVKSSSFSSELCPRISDLNAKDTHKPRWTSLPPSRRDSGSAACGGSKEVRDPPAVSADAKTHDSPKRKGNALYLLLWTGFYLLCL